MPYTILYIATSAHGFIADKNGNLDWLPQVSRTFLQTLSFITSGFVLDLPYQNKYMYVFTRQLLYTDRTDVMLVASVEKYLSIINQNKVIQRIWLLGGAELIASFKAYNLIDELIITILPLDLNEGIALPKLKEFL